MKSPLKHILLLVLVLACCSTAAVKAQVKVGNNPRNLQPDAALEIESANKGLLLPRLALTSTTSFAPMSAFVQGMFVYNTASQNDITPGVYYCDGSKWIKLNNNTTNGSTGVKKSLEVVTTDGQTVFNTPAPITDANKISLYRNGVMIAFTVTSNTSITAEISCMRGDEIRIVQIL